MAVSLECNQVFWIGLGVMEDHKHAWCAHLIHNAVVYFIGVAPLGRRCNHVRLSDGEVPRQHTAEVHEFIPILVGLGVCVTGRVTGTDSKI